MKKWNDKTKKAALVAALVIVGAGAFCGIRFTLKTDKPVEPVLENATASTDDVEVTIDAGYEKSAEQDTEGLVISTEPIDSSKTADMNDATQSIQNDPVKTEEKKPDEPPAEVTAAEQNTTTTKPENQTIPAGTTETSEREASNATSSSQNGEIKDGKIYIEGFGWVDYDGGGTSGTQGTDIYENGNKIGIMD